MLLAPLSASTTGLPVPTTASASTAPMAATLAFAMFPKTPIAATAAILLPVATATGTAPTAALWLWTTA